MLFFGYYLPNSIAIHPSKRRNIVINCCLRFIIVYKKHNFYLRFENKIEGNVTFVVYTFTFNQASERHTFL